jgi:hypothetical protein
VIVEPILVELTIHQILAPDRCSTDRCSVNSGTLPNGLIKTNAKTAISTSGDVNRANRLSFADTSGPP